MLAVNLFSPIRGGMLAKKARFLGTGWGFSWERLLRRITFNGWNYLEPVRLRETTGLGFGANHAAKYMPPVESFALKICGKGEIGQICRQL